MAGVTFMQIITSSFDEMSLTCTTDQRFNIEFVQTSASFVVEKGNLCPLMSLHFHDEQLVDAIINYKHFVVYFIEFGFL